MSCNEYQMFIHQFLENDLEIQFRENLFDHLSSCETCKNYFSTVVSVQTTLREDGQEFPVSLNQQIFSSFPKVNEKGTHFSNFFTLKMPAYLTYAVMIIIVAVGMLFFNQLNKYKEELHETALQLKEQKQTIEMLYHAMPTIEVHPVSTNNL